MTTLIYEEKIKNRIKDQKSFQFNFDEKKRKNVKWIEEAQRLVT